MSVSQKKRQYWWLALACFLIALGTSYWVWQERLRLRVQSLDVESRIQAFETRLRAREEVLAEIRLLEERNPSDDLLLEGGTAQLAGAELQGLINQVIEGSGGEVETSELLAPEDAAPFLDVGVLVQVNATIPALRDILHAMESSIPVILVKAIDATQQDDVSQDLRIELEVRGFARGASS